MAGPSRQPTTPPRNALIRLYQWLWRGLLFLWTGVVLTLVLGIITTWLTIKGFDISGTPLEWIPDHLPLVLAAGGLLLVLTVGAGYLGRPVASPARVLPTPQDRRALIRRLSDEYRRQQTQSLQEAVMKSLEGQKPTAVTLSSASLVSWRMDVPGKATLATPTPIVQAYDQASAGLLIVGDPGVGKSTLLLELALGLLTCAEQDTTQTQPVPVLVNLSSWALSKPPLTTWLEEQLHSMCGIQRHLSHAWIEQNELLLLLDGLDEMEPSARTTCVASIDAYRNQAEHVVALVVSSRRDEFLAQEGRLKGLATVEVQQLTPEQVDGYLKRVGKPLAVVRAALRSNTILRELVTTPLLLSMVILAYQGKTVEDLPHLGSAEEQQRQVFEHYVKRRLEQQTPGWHYASQHTRQWLIWLAEQMKQHQLIEFYVERLQPTWLATKQSQTFYILLAMLLYGLVGGLFLGIPLGLLYGLLGGLCGGLLGWMSIERPGGNREIRFAEVLVWSWRGIQFGLLVGLQLGLLVGLLVWLAGEQADRQAGGLVGWLVGGLGGRVAALLVGLITALLVGLIFGLLGGVKGVQITKDQRIRPNQGIQSSGRNALHIGLIFGLVGALLYWWSISLGFGLLGGLLGGLCGGLLFGGAAYLQHYILRFLLWRSGAMPWHYVRFLEEATERKLLQSVGGGYRFIHPLFREHFASLETRTSTSTWSSSSPQS